MQLWYWPRREAAGTTRGPRHRKSRNKRFVSVCVAVEASFLGSPCFVRLKV